ncbi:hypothetical protein R1sor_018635 [Riccia sorocarpa]|uniref:Uncharacterized protein n=1 Tax=Riccia sorocarpa TaxID=122646 RepID=A0ABD3IA84_9MARC
MAAKVFGIGGQSVPEKVKFTVSVRGHQLSSARHINETLQEFARVIQRNARRLVFIGENDSIQRLQLAQADGSEPEELDVDATLEDVIICMGNKHLVAIITPAKPPTPFSSRLEAEKLGPPSPMALQKSKPKKDVTNGYIVPASSSAALSPEGSELATCGLSTQLSSLKSSYEPPVQGLKITIPSGDSNSAVFQDERNSFVQDFATAGERQSYGGQTLAPRHGNYVGEILCNSGLPGPVTSSVATPSPAELAHFLVRGSTMPLTRAQPPPSMCMNITTMYPSCQSGAADVGGYQTFASSFPSRLPMMPTSNLVSTTSPPNIALLVQFLASQLRAFIPMNETSSPPDSASLSPSGNNNKVEASSTDTTPMGNKAGETAGYQNGNKPSETSWPKGFRQVPDNGLPNLASETAKPSISDAHDKDDSSSSANVNTATAPSSDGLESETMHDRSELVFLVRSLESTIHGLEHTIAVGQGAGMEELTEAYMRSEVSKLQQEMDQLVHGTPVQQHSPVARTADLYKRLYSRGWRSKYHSACGRFDLDLNTDSRGSEGVVSFNRRGTTDEAKPHFTKTKTENGGSSPEDVEPNSTMPKASLCKDDSLSQTNTGIIDNINDNASSLCTKGAELGVLKESTVEIRAELVTNSTRIRTQKELEELSVDVEVVGLEPEKNILLERCSKRQKTEVS